MRNPRRPRRFLVSAAILASSLAPFANPAFGSAFTLTCGNPTSTGGTIVLGVSTIDFSGMPVSFPLRVPITAGLTASEKCAAIAETYRSTAPFSNATTSGNTVTFANFETRDLTGLEILSDTTGESTSLSTSLAPRQLVSLIEIPVTNLDAVPPAGRIYQPDFFLDDGSVVSTTFVTSDGKKTAGMLLNNIFDQFAQDHLIFNIPVMDPNTNDVVGFRTQAFDPTTATVDWDANTSLDLANFGLLVQSADTASPEPGTAFIVAACLIAIFLPRRSQKEGIIRWSRIYTSR